MSIFKFDNISQLFLVTLLMNLTRILLVGLLPVSLTYFRKSLWEELWVSEKSALAGGSFYNASVKIFLFTFYAKLPCVCKHDKRGFALCQTLLIFFLFLFNLWNLWMTRERFYSSRAFICLKLTMETLENRKKSVQS